MCFQQYLRHQKLIDQIEKELEELCCLHVWMYLGFENSSVGLQSLSMLHRCGWLGSGDLEIERGHNDHVQGVYVIVVRELLHRSWFQTLCIV